MTNSTRKNFLLCLALLGLSAVTVSAQSDTVPSGYYTVNINAGSGTSYAISVISFPLQQTADTTIGGVTSGPAGQMVGQVTAITSSTITNSNAGWTAGQLSVPATPYLIQFTSGAAAGRTFLLSTTTANTSTVLTLDAGDASKTDLTTLGIVAGTDTYQIIAADTISSIFGTPATTGVVGGASASVSDQIQLFTPGGVWQAYYYNTTNGWVRTTFPTASGNTVIRPDTAVVYSRIGSTALSLVLMGQAPAVGRQTAVNNSGVTFLSNFWPVDMGLGATAVENGVTLQPSNIQSIPGWTAGASVSVADSIQVFTAGGVWQQYFYNGTHWTKPGLPTNNDSIIIAAGSAIIMVKQGSATGQSVLSEAIPYSL